MATKKSTGRKTAKKTPYITKKAEASGKGVYDVLLDKLLEAVNGDVDPGEWQRTWAIVCGGTGPRNPFSTVRDLGEEHSHAYRGGNVMMLVIDAALHHYTSPYWAGFHQIEEAGGKVKKGAKASYILQPINRKKEQENKQTGETETVSWTSWRYATVFNLSQVEGLDLDAVIAAEEAAMQKYLRDNPPIEAAERIWENCPNRPEAEIVAGCNQPCYIPALDKMEMPVREQFEDSDQYYSVLFHELTHSIKHDDRLGKGRALARAGKHYRPVEEVIAETGALFLSMQAGITTTENNTLAYLKSWGAGIKDDPELVFLAFAEAQARVDYVLMRSRQSEMTVTESEAAV